MCEIFRKGQLVPRRLRACLSVDAKAQHCIVFGCDVEVTGRRFKCLTEGPVFHVSHGISRRMNNGTRKKCGLTLTNVHVWGDGLVVLIKGVVDE